VTRTSSPAPAIFSCTSALYKASSSIIGPLARLSSKADGFIKSNECASISCKVFLLSGQCIDIISDSLRRVS